MSSSTSFDRYYEEFQSLTEQVSFKLSSLSDKAESVNDGASSSSKQWTTDIDGGDLKIVQDLLLQADDIIKQMGLEARGVNDNGTKKELLEKVRICKTHLAKLREEYNTTKECIERMNLGLNSKTSNNDDNELNNNILLRSQNETLTNARNVIAETENVALDITQELSRQRETISSVNDHVDEVTSITDRAQRIVQSMTRRKESLFKFR